MISGKLYKVVNVNKIMDNDTTFVRYEYWYADQAKFKQIRFDWLLYIQKTYDKETPEDSLGLSEYLGSQTLNIFGVNKNTQIYSYSESGMANYQVTVQTAEFFGIIKVSYSGYVETAGSHWSSYIKLEKAIIDGKIYKGNIVSVDNDNKLPENYILRQNYPNPFNPMTKISYGIPHKSLVEIKVYDSLGREIRVLKNKVLEAGNYTVSFDGVNLPSGVYFYQLKTDKYTKTRKMILLR
ncbi:MAG: T9SS type A sorting domain-containing protein [Rhodothermaceae bacterium]